MNKTISALAVAISGFAFAAAGALALSGCTASTPGTTTSTPATTAAAAPAKATTPKPAPKPANPTFGQSFTWTDGLSVSLSKPATYTPSPEAAGAGANNIIIDVAFHNGSNANVDLTLAGVEVTSGEQAGEDVIDIDGPQGDVDGMAPQVPLLPGQTVHWKAAFAVANPADVTADFTLNDYEHADALFTN